jgi:hypothetical protein
MADLLVMRNLSIQKYRRILFDQAISIGYVARVTRYSWRREALRVAAKSSGLEVARALAYHNPKSWTIIVYTEQIARFWNIQAVRMGT